MAAAGAEVLTAVRSSERVAEEQAALRRVATLVARAAAPEVVFAAVAAETGRLLGCDLTVLGRYDPDGAVTVLGAWSDIGAAVPVPGATRTRVGGMNVTSLVFETGRPARLDDYGAASGPIAEVSHEFGIRAAVGVPISVEGRVWGVMIATSNREQLLPADAETRLAGFTELVASAIANTQARVELRGFAEEQAALRRVATLVAQAAPPEEVFAAVTAEVGWLLEVDFTFLSRYDPNSAATVVGAWSRTGDAVPFPADTRLRLGGRNVHTLVYETRRPERMDAANASGPAAEAARAWDISSSVGTPISVEGRLWGVMGVTYTRGKPLPADTEARLAGFTGLVATAIATTQARLELHGFAEEQAALRRVATQVARSAPPEEVFAAVAEEAGKMLGCDFTVLSRYDPDGAVTVVGGWSRTDPGRPPAIGIRVVHGGRNMHSLVLRTGQPARIDDYGTASGAAAEVARDWGFRSAVGAPIRVGGRLWGVISVASSGAEPLPAETEARLAGFTELVGTALANAEAQAALTASRARIVAATDTARRRIERDLHDGAQQRLVALALQLRMARAVVPPEAAQLVADLDGVADGLADVLDELREIARGIHPSVLAEGGLRPALSALGRRSAVPVRLDMGTTARFPEPIEIAAYYAVSEALTNTAKHADATVADVHVNTSDGVLHISVRDDGRGGADLTRGSGLIGLRDRVETLGGQLFLDSLPGAGTIVRMTLPLPAPSEPPPASSGR